MNIKEALIKLEQENISRSEYTVRRWIKDGKLKANLREGKIPLGYEIDNESLDELISKMNEKKNYKVKKGEIKRCEVKSCRKHAKRQGYCYKHYDRLKKYGSTRKPKRQVIKRMIVKKMCSVDNCEKYVDSNGLCPTHLYNYKTYGDPLWNEKRKSKGLETIFFMDLRDKKVAFESQIRTRYNIPSSKSNIIRNYKTHNKDIFVEEIHFVKVYSDDLNNLRNKYENEVYSFKALSPNIKMVNMYTEEGVRVIVEFLKRNGHIKED